MPHEYSDPTRAMLADIADGEPLPEDGYVYRSSRRDGGRAPETVCYTVDTRIGVYSYLGTTRIDGADLHTWRVRPNQTAARSAVNVGGLSALEPFRFRPYYVFSSNVAT